MHRLLIIGAISVCLSTTLLAFEPTSAPASAGVLDEPLFNPNMPSTVQPAAPAAIPSFAPAYGLLSSPPDPNLTSNDPEERQEAVQNAVEEEMEALEALPTNQVEALAESGARAAQVVLGIEYAREAQSLVGIPAAANQAAEDAVRWYSQAARRGFPGAPSLDYAGVSFYPIRVQRSRN